MTTIHRGQVVGSSERLINGVDIELNATDFSWVGAPSDKPLIDLRAALMHEIGHAIGFEHVCRVGTPGAATGIGLPPCADASPELVRSVMWPGADVGASQRLTMALGPEDQHDLCSLYPAPVATAPDTSCAVAGQALDDRGVGQLALLLGVALLCVRRVVARRTARA